MEKGVVIKDEQDLFKFIQDNEEILCESRDSLEYCEMEGYFRDGELSVEGLKNLFSKYPFLKSDDDLREYLKTNFRYPPSREKLIQDLVETGFMKTRGDGYITAWALRSWIPKSIKKRKRKLTFRVYQVSEVRELLIELENSEFEAEYFKCKVKVSFIASIENSFSKVIGSRDLTLIPEEKGGIIIEEIKDERELIWRKN